MTTTQAVYFWNRSLCRLAALLTGPCALTQLLSLYYAPGPSIPSAIVDRQYRTLMDQARRLAGGPFRYVKVTEYSASPLSPPIIHRLFLELPAEMCQGIAKHWFMGNATVERLSTQQLTDFAADLMARRPGDRREKGRRIWTTSLGLAQQPQRNPQAPADLGSGLTCILTCTPQERGSFGGLFGRIS